MKSKLVLFSNFVLVVILVIVLDINCSNGTDKKDSNVDVPINAPIPALEDAIIMSHQPERNFGTSSEFILTNNNSILARNVGLIKFNIPLLDSAAYKNVFLNLKFNKKSSYGPAHAGNFDLIVKMVENNWFEEEVTWANRPSYSSSDSIVVGPSLINGSGDMQNLDVTEFYRIAVSKKQNQLSLYLSLSEKNSYSKFLFTSQNNEVDLRPFLIFS